MGATVEKLWVLLLCALVCAPPALSTVDPASDYLRRCTGGEYSARQQRLWEEGGSTHYAYTRGEPDAAPDLKAFLKDPNNWVPERRAVHDRILSDYSSSVADLSGALKQSPFAQANPETPLLILTRGNSGSGKTYALTHAQDPFLRSLGLGEAVGRFEAGVINPDVVKAKLQNVEEKGRVSSQQVHEEGSMMADRLVDEALAKKHSFILDKRFATSQSMAGVAQRAKAAGYRVVVVDVDAPVEVSSQRILDRPLGGGSPNVPMEPIASGYREARSHREDVAGQPFIDDYFSFAMDPARPGSHLIASRKAGGPVQVHDDKKWKDITKAPPHEEEARVVRLYGDLLDSLSRTLPADFLRPYRTEAVTNRQDSRTDVFEISQGGVPKQFQLLPEDIEHHKDLRRITHRVGDRFNLSTGMFSAARTYEVTATDGEKITLKDVARGGTVEMTRHKFEKRQPEFLPTEKDLEEFRRQAHAYWLHGLAEYRYQAKKSGDPYFHEHLAWAAKEYIRRTVPGVEFESQLIPGSPERDPEVRLLIKGVDHESAVRLTGDREWSIRMAAGNAPDRVNLSLSTRDLTLRDAPTGDPVMYRGIGFGGVTDATPGSVGHDFIRSRTDLLRLYPERADKRDIPAIEISVTGTSFTFPREADNARHRRGFRSDEPAAYAFAAQIELFHARKKMDQYRKSKDPAAREEARKLAESARLNADLALHYSGFADLVYGHAEATLRQAIPASVPERSSMQMAVLLPTFVGGGEITGIRGHFTLAADSGAGQSMADLVRRHRVALTELKAKVREVDTEASALLRD